MDAMHVAHGDENFEEYSLAESAVIDARVHELTAEKLASPVWWSDVIEGVNVVTGSLAEQLARCMRNLDKACDGESIGRDAITTTLSQLQKNARSLAQAEAKDEAEAEYERGELAV